MLTLAEMLVPDFGTVLWITTLVGPTLAIIRVRWSLD